MHDYLLAVIGCVCMLHAGLCDEGCERAILARRQVVHVPAGRALSLSCLVRHCGLNWTGTWLWKNSTDEHLSTVKDTGRHHFIKATHSADEAKLTLSISSVNQVDEGSYGCSVTWGDGDTDRGHLMYVNITAAVLYERNVLHRIFICAGAFLCVPIMLGMAYCLNSGLKSQLLPRAEFTYAAMYRHEPHPAPQPPPRPPLPLERKSSPYKAPPRTHRKAEVVYADISQDALQQQGASREPVQSTVYSLLKFP